MWSSRRGEASRSLQIQPGAHESLGRRLITGQVLAAVTCCQPPPHPVARGIPPAIPSQPRALMGTASSDAPCRTVLRPLAGAAGGSGSCGRPRAPQPLNI